MTERPAIAVVDTGPDWVTDALAQAGARTHALLDAQSRGARAAAALGDRVARRWLARGDAATLAEIDAVAARVGRPGAHYLNASYDFGCSTVAAPGPEGGAPLLARVLDWPTPGLGRWATAIRVRGCAAGPWACLGWPGFIGVLQGVAPGRFAAALNQAPLPARTGVRALDWAANAAATWARPRLSPSHLLRRVFETAPDAATAEALLRDTPLASGAIFVLAGADGRAQVIERSPDAAASPPGPAAAANAWRTPGWRGGARGEDNEGRLRMVAALAPSLADPAGWLRAPVLNGRTRLLFVADPVSGAFAAQGYENGAAVTAMLRAAA